MKLTSLKSLKLARPRLGQLLMPLAAIALGFGLVERPGSISTDPAARREKRHRRRVVLPRAH